MKTRLIRAGRELSWVALGQGAAALGGLLGVRLLTEVLPPDIYGELALAMTVVGLVQVTLQQPLFEVTRRFFVSAAQRGETRAFLHASRRLAWRISFRTAATGLAGILILVVLDGVRWVPLATASLALSVVTTWSLAISGILSARRQRALVATQEGLQQWLRFGLAAALVWGFGPHSSVAMAGYAIAVAVVLAHQQWSLRRTLPDAAAGHGPQDSAAARAWNTRLVGDGWPFALWGAALSIQAATARWSLQIFEASEAVGLYAALFQVGHYPVALLVGILLKFASPIVFNRAVPDAAHHDKASAYRLSRLLVAAALGVTLCATFAALAFHDVLFAAFAAQEYRRVSWLLPIQVLGSGLLVSARSAAVSSMVAAGTRALVAPQLASAAIGSSLTVLGAWTYGLSGVVLAGVANGALSFAAIAVSGRARPPAIRQPSPPPARP